MKVQGRVKQILPLREGVSQRTGNAWKALPFILEFFESDDKRFADTMKLETYDTKVIDNLQENMEVICWVSHHVREWEGQTYNEIRLHRVESLQHAQQAAQGDNAIGADNQPTQQPKGEQAFPQAAPQAETDDLPF